MRPLSLTISGFGPYAGTVEIPMEQLGSKGLYLITGDTGAGKTTIYDAVCFALFGEASGDNRDGKMLRSKYAELEDPTEVELVFEHMGKVYTVKRNPDYVRKARRGEGTTNEVAAATLTMPDGRIVTKIKTVNEEIVQILGVNKDQFKQIVMIAQGNFQKVLFAETNERMEIFRKLFKTEKYDTLAGRLASARKDVEDQVTQNRASIAQYIKGIQMNEDDVLSVDVERAKTGGMTTGDVIELLEKLIAQDAEVIEALDGEAKAIRAELEAINQDIGVAESLERTRQDLNKEQGTLESLKANSTSIEEKLTEAARNLEGKTELDKKAHEISLNIPEYDALDALVQEYRKTVSQLDSAQKELDKKVKSESQKQTEQKELSEEQKKLSKAGELLSGLNNDKEKCEERLNACDELFTKYREYIAEIEKYKQLLQDFKSANEEFERLNNSYEEQDQKYRFALAGILASKLEEGRKCPVCGSIHHPEKAHLEEDVPSEEQVKEAKRKAETARSKSEKMARESEKYNASCKEKEKALKEAAAKLNIDSIDNLDSKLGSLKKTEKSKLSEIEQKIRTEKRNAQRRDELDNIIPRIDKELEELAKAIVELRSSISGLETGRKSLLKQIEDKKEKLTFESKAAAETEMKRLEQTGRALQAAFDKAKSDSDAHSQKIKAAETTIITLTKTISAAKSVDMDALMQKKSEQDKLQLANADKSKAHFNSLQANRNIKSNIQSKSGDIGELEKKLQWMAVLADTAKGDLSGKVKMKLETYIQTTYFDRIINRANLRLMTMSSGQYELKRQEDDVSKRSQAGLDLAVIDHYNGSERPVKSLSGGETFMASLSLALGLSDEIQASAGGIQLDTLFVDEGFGSLDPESLNQAFKALAGLTEGNRLVGIISHVGELKEKIDRQIIVTKQKSGGSTIKMV